MSEARFHAMFHAGEDIGIDSGIHAAACDLFVILGSHAYFAARRFGDLETAKRHGRPILAFIQPGAEVPAGLLGDQARTIAWDFTRGTPSELVRAVNEHMDRLRGTAAR